ncbi:MAG: gamma-glutamyl-gamma-aminobutyrate hydrolase family protein [Erysipelotrichaceae bacterium]|nr:gamma-glutamyl-gamma-aminobutyrate hydrolase family protein [Erysipelotrichaceae bacterium]
MRRPVIGIPAKEREKSQNDYWHRMEVVDDLRYLIVKNGGIAVMLLPSEVRTDFNKSDLEDPTVLSEEEKEALHQEVDLCDGILLQGGDYSNAYEVEIARYALEKDLPVLGICAGFNNILRALGSNIYEDETKTHSRYDIDYRHGIRVAEGTLLYDLIQSGTYEVNSFHTMVADEGRVKGFARIDAYSDDGLVEAFDLKDHRFALALKWHPELMKEDRFTKELFRRFIDACRKGE